MKHTHTCLLLRGPPHSNAVRVGDLLGDALLGDAPSAPVPDCSRVDSCRAEVDLAQKCCASHAKCA